MTVKTVYGIHSIKAFVGGKEIPVNLNGISFIAGEDIKPGDLVYEKPLEGSITFGITYRGKMRFMNSKKVRVRRKYFKKLLRNLELLP